jgi:hypothetical protein
MQRSLIRHAAAGLQFKLAETLAALFQAAMFSDLTL